MGSRLASSFSVDVFVQNPVRSVVLHDVSIQLPITEFFIGYVFSNDPLDRQNFVRQSPSSAQDDIGSDLSSLTCIITRPNLGCVDLVRKLAPRALLQPPPDSNSLPRLQVLLQVLTCTLHMAHLFQMHLHELGYVQLFQICLHNPLLAPPMWDHNIYVQPLQAREVPVLPWWEQTILLIQMHMLGLCSRSSFSPLWSIRT